MFGSLTGPPGRQSCRGTSQQQGRGQMCGPGDMNLAFTVSEYLVNLLLSDPLKLYVFDISKYRIG